MPARTTAILGATLAAAFATALPTLAADRLGGAGDGGLGPALVGLLAQSSGGIFSHDDGDNRRTEQAARLCLDHAEDEVRGNGGDAAHVDRLIDGDRVRLLADMSADHDGDRCSAKVECEVDFEGSNQVTAFRQVGEAGGGNFDDLLRDLLGQQ